MASIISCRRAVSVAYRRAGKSDADNIVSIVSLKDHIGTLKKKNIMLKSPFEAHSLILRRPWYFKRKFSLRTHCKSPGYLIPTLSDSLPKKELEGNNIVLPSKTPSPGVLHPVTTHTDLKPRSARKMVVHTLSAMVPKNYMITTTTRTSSKPGE